MNLEKIKQITSAIKELEKQLDVEKQAVLEHFRNMSEEDVALCENKIGDNGIIVTYYPQSKSRSVDSAKLKADGLYDKYSKEVNKSDYIKVNVTKD